MLDIADFRGRPIEKQIPFSLPVSRDDNALAKQPTSRHHLAATPAEKESCYFAHFFHSINLHTNTAMSDYGHEVGPAAEKAFSSPTNLTASRLGRRGVVSPGAASSGKSVSSNRSRRAPSVITSQEEADLFDKMNQAMSINMRKKKNKVADVASPSILHSVSAPSESTRHDKEEFPRSPGSPGSIYSADNVQGENYFSPGGSLSIASPGRVTEEKTFHWNRKQHRGVELDIPPLEEKKSTGEGDDDERRPAGLYNTSTTFGKEVGVHAKKTIITEDVGPTPHGASTPSNTSQNEMSNEIVEEIPTDERETATSPRVLVETVGNSEDSEEAASFYESQSKAGTVSNDDASEKKANDALRTDSNTAPEFCVTEGRDTTATNACISTNPDNETPLEPLKTPQNNERRRKDEEGAPTGGQEIENVAAAVAISDPCMAAGETLANIESVACAQDSIKKQENVEADGSNIAYPSRHEPLIDVASSEPNSLPCTSSTAKELDTNLGDSKSIVIMDDAALVSTSISPTEEKAASTIAENPFEVFTSMSVDQQESSVPGSVPPSVVGSTAAPPTYSSQTDTAATPDVDIVNNPQIYPMAQNVPASPNFVQRMPPSEISHQSEPLSPVSGLGSSIGTSDPRASTPLMLRLEVELREAIALAETADVPETEAFWRKRAADLHGQLETHRQTLHAARQNSHHNLVEQHKGLQYTDDYYAMQQPGNGVAPSHVDAFEYESRMVDVIAPADLPGGYHFEAEIEGQRFLATVPPGGVQQGETFTCYMRELNSVAIDIPVGNWKDNTCQMCIHGLCHPTFWHGLFCPLILLGQVTHRLGLDFLGRPKYPGAEQRFSNRFMVLVVTCTWGSLNLLLLYAAHFKWIRAMEFTASDWTAFALVNVFMYCFIVFVAQSTRSSIREKFMIQEERCYDLEDVMCASLCMPCSVAQMARHTANYDDYEAVCCSKTGLPDGVTVKHTAPMKEGEQAFA